MRYRSIRKIRALLMASSLLQAQIPALQPRSGVRDVELYSPPVGLIRAAFPHSAGQINEAPLQVLQATVNTPSYRILFIVENVDWRRDTEIHDSGKPLPLVTRCDISRLRASLDDPSKPKCLKGISTIKMNAMKIAGSHVTANEYRTEFWILSIHGKYIFTITLLQNVRMQPRHLSA